MIGRGFLKDEACDILAAILTSINALANSCLSKIQWPYFQI